MPKSKHRRKTAKKAVAHPGRGRDGGPLVVQWEDDNQSVEIPPPAEPIDADPAPIGSSVGGFGVELESSPNPELQAGQQGSVR
jgi:hypothetical protein